MIDTEALGTTLDLAGSLPVVGGATKLLKPIAKVTKPLVKKAITKVDNMVYPTRTYRAHPVSNKNITFTGDDVLANKITKKGDFTTTNLEEVSQYLKGNSKRSGIFQGDDMVLTETKVPFWKKNASKDADVIALKKQQGVDVNPNEYIIPRNHFLYPQRSNVIKAAPEELLSRPTTINTPSGPTTYPLYSPSTIPAHPTSHQFASPPYKYLEDQINAVTGHEIPFSFNPQKVVQPNYTVPLESYVQPKIAPNAGIGTYGVSNQKEGGFVRQDLKIDNFRSWENLNIKMLQ